MNREAKRTEFGKFANKCSAPGRPAQVTRVKARKPADRGHRPSRISIFDVRVSLSGRTTKSKVKTHP